jgi:hypothetical protein
VLEQRERVRKEDVWSTFAIDTNWPFSRLDTFCIHYAGMRAIYKAITMRYDAEHAFA